MKFRNPKVLKNSKRKIKNSMKLVNLTILMKFKILPLIFARIQRQNNKCRIIMRKNKFFMNKFANKIQYVHNNLIKKMKIFKTNYKFYLKI